MHAVFSTKDRQKLIAPDVQDSLWRFVVGTGANHSIPVLAVGGISDHLHVLYVLPSTLTVAQSIQKLKSNSSRWMSERVRGFSWQQGYGAFSVSMSQKQSVMDYIAGQEEHHKKQSFEDEFIALLQKHNVEFDLKYVFG